MKERMDIEALLEWAYRRQCVDRVASARFTPRGPSGDANGAAVQMMVLGCRVQTSTYAEKVLGATAPDDALVIHDTVLALGEMWIDEQAGLWTRERAAGIGMSIEWHGGAWWLACAGMGRSPLSQACTAALVIQHAKSGSRPEWCKGWVAPRGAVAADATGRDQRGRKRREYQGLGREEVAHYRATYEVWHAALVALAGLLRDALTDHEVIGPAASPEPWLDEAEKPVRFQKYNEVQTIEKIAE